MANRTFSNTVRERKTLVSWKDLPIPSLVRMAGERGVMSFPLKKTFPFSRAVLPGDHIEEGGLSCAIRSDNRLESERKDLSVDMIDGDMTAESNGKVLGFNDGVLGHTDPKTAL